MRVARHGDGVERLGDRADLIQFDQQGIADFFVDAFPQNLRIRHEHIVADQLHAVAKMLRQQLPAVPVAFGDAVFDRRDRVLPDPVLVQLDHFLGRALAFARFLERVAAISGPELARRDIERDEDVVAGLAPRFADGLQHDFDGLAVGLQVRREAAFVADAGGLAALLEDGRAAHERFPHRFAAPRQTNGAPTGITMNSWKSTLESA